MIDVEKHRKLFPIIQEKIQLSSCSQSAMHKQVKESINQYLNSWEESGMEWSSWMNKCESARRKFADMINAEEEEIAIVSSVSHAVSSIAASLPKKKGKKRVLITESDFPTVGQIWLAQKDYKVFFIDPNENHEIELEQYEEEITDDTLITSVSHVSYYNGFRQNVKKISEIAHKKDSYIFVDAYQSSGQIPIDVKKDDVDFLATGLQKYMLGIPGIAFLYIKKEISEQLTPKVTGWFGQKNPFDFDIKGTNYAPKTKRFDSGTYPMINSFAADAALDILLEVGVHNIESYLKELSKYAIEYSLESGLILKSPLDSEKKGSTLAIHAHNASEIEGLMKQKGIIVSARNDVVRIAPHFYNNKEDIASAIEEIAKIIVAT